MLDALKFVQRGVARRDLIPGLTHFRIKDKRVTGFNGEYSLSAPIEIGFDVAPNAGLFTKALDACEDVISLTKEGSQLLIKSGAFRTSIPCIPLEDVPATFPEGTMVYPHASVLSALTALRPFIGVDASRPWSMGVLLSRESAYATNNVVVAEYWMGVPFPFILNVPSSIIEEVVRVKEELSGLQIASGSITFHYADGRWIKSQLLALDWPDIVGVLDSALASANFSPVPIGLADACEKLSRFCAKKDSRVFLRGTDISTKREGAVDGGALIELGGIPSEGCFHIQYLESVLRVADQIDIGSYPKPVPFIGPKLRGALCGIRV